MIHFPRTFEALLSAKACRGVENTVKPMGDKSVARPLERAGRAYHR
ncbi:Hypothetical protein I595_446 [Croceitalea dokdonensis DOKDO 023]|uniref:Uncharacterized protein n=1 Tax=Croceitalea dokdonensis DOKDO 023 TaxID=1300341 RepID=A0A0P7AXL3_9FLAO|nr:Hypothetical protein I595_446 [Croceitalea dokdonensis DOKDO 023]